MSCCFRIQAVSVLGVLALSAVVEVQSPPAGGYLSSDVLPGSPTVLITRVTRKAAAGDQLELLMLWRGAPGWYLQRPRRSSTGERHGVFREDHQYGDVTLRIVLDPKTATVQVNDQSVDLRSSAARALLIDGLGTAGSLNIEKVEIDRRVSSGGPALLKLFRDSRKLREFLRCEDPKTDQRDRSGASALCAAL